MTASFAPARSAAYSPLARVVRAVAPAPAANDNGDWDADPALGAALLHFAQHGLGAARSARDKAEAALRGSDREGAGKWLAICRVLDRRMAADLVRRVPVPAR
jgi:hypothetical protein